MDREPSPFRVDDDDHVGDEEMADIIHQAHSLEGSPGFFFNDFIGHWELGAVAMFDPRESPVDDLVALGPTVDIHDLAGHFESESESDDGMDVDPDALVDDAIASVNSAGQLYQVAPPQNAQANAPPTRGGVFRHIGGCYGNRRCFA